MALDFELFMTFFEGAVKGITLLAVLVGSASTIYGLFCSDEVAFSIGIRAAAAPGCTVYVK